LPHDTHFAKKRVVEEWFAYFHADANCAPESGAAMLSERGLPLPWRMSEVQIRSWLKISLSKILVWL
jgi:hypothetical protein